MAVQFAVANAHVGAHEAVAQLHAADAALEAVNVVEQAQTLDDHRRTPTYDNINNVLIWTAIYDTIILSKIILALG